MIGVDVDMSLAEAMLWMLRILVWIAVGSFVAGLATLPLFFFVLSVLLPLFSLVGLLLAVRVPKNEINRATRIHSLLVALACCVVTAFVASWHFIGLRIWTP